MSSQTTYLTTTRQRKCTIRILNKQFVFQSLKSFLRYLSVFRINISFIYRFCISIHTLWSYRCFRKIAFTLGLINHLVPQAGLILVFRKCIGKPLYPAYHIGTSRMILWNIVQSIHQSHKPPADTAPPEVRWMSRFRICPTLAFTLVPSMMLVTKCKLFNCLIYPHRLIELRPILCQKRWSHIQTIQPYLVLINQFMPICTLQCTGMVLQLFY